VRRIMDLKMYREVKYTEALPYRKIFGSLNDYKVDLVKKTEEKKYNYICFA